MSEYKSSIPSRLYNAAVDGHVAGADQIIDDKTGLTLDKVAGGALEEKEYTSDSNNGMGRVVLRKNIVNGVNTLTKSMINKNNTIYIIQYDFTLGEDITIPENCVLEFDGGSLNNGNINISNFYIKSGNYKIFNNIKFINNDRTNKAIKNEYIDATWFGIVNDGGLTDQSSLFEKAMVASLMCNTKLYFPSGVYKGHFKIKPGDNLPLTGIYKTLVHYASKQKRIIDFNLIGDGENETIFLSDGVNPVIGVYGNKPDGVFLWGCRFEHFGIRAFDEYNNNANAIEITYSQRIDFRHISIHDISGHFIYGEDWMDSTCELLELIGEGRQFLNNNSYAIYLTENKDSSNNLRFSQCHIEGTARGIHSSGLNIHFNQIKYEKWVQNTTEYRPICLEGGTIFTNSHFFCSDRGLNIPVETYDGIDNGMPFITQVAERWPSGGFHNCIFNSEARKYVNWVNNVRHLTFDSCYFNNCIGGNNDFGFTLGDFNTITNCYFYCTKITENKNLFNITGNKNLLKGLRLLFAANFGTLDNIIKITGTNNLIKIDAFNGTIPEKAIATNSDITIKTAQDSDNHYLSVTGNGNKIIFEDREFTQCSINEQTSIIDVGFSKNIYITGTYSTPIDSIIGQFNEGDILTIKTKTRLIFKKKTNSIGNLLLSNDLEPLDFNGNISFVVRNDGTLSVTSVYNMLPTYTVQFAIEERKDYYDKNTIIFDNFTGLYKLNYGRVGNGNIKNVLDAITVNGLPDFNNPKDGSYLIKSYSGATNYPELAGASVGRVMNMMLDTIRYQIFYNGKGIFIRSNNNPWISCQTISVTTSERTALTQLYAGLTVFDSDLGKAVWYNGTAWVDATGTPV